MNIRPMIPGIWSIGTEATGTVAALGTIRRSRSGFAFVPQPAGSNAERELAAAGVAIPARDGFASLDDAAAYVTTSAIAASFSSVLRRWLTADEIAEVNRRNATADYAGTCCASHDFCDANVAMDEAFTAITGRELDPTSDADAAVWNQSWNAAKGAGFSIA